MLKYILVATALVFSTHAFAVDTPKCSEGMVWDETLGVCVESPVVVPAGDGEMQMDMDTNVEMDKTMDDSSGK